MRLYCETFPNGGRIPELCAYGRLGSDGQMHLGANLNPHLEWGEVPEGTQSFVLLCLDDDVPTSRDVLDTTGEIPAFIARRRFVHWMQANLGVDVRQVSLGALSGENKGAAGFGVTGRNDYNPTEPGQLIPGMVGTGYDGPCPPMTDSRWHVYRFVVIAVDTMLDVSPLFTYEELMRELDGHILGMDEWIGHYSLNPRLQGHEHS